MRTEELLEAACPSMLIVEMRKTNRIVIGVPHHAPAGTTKLEYCSEHPNSDENTGHLGRYLADQLNCCSIIACNYVFDVNKCLRTDYAVQIAKWAPKILVEIHAHSGKGHPVPKDVEISCGSRERNKFSVELATKLQAALDESPQVTDLSINGDFVMIPGHLKATQSVTITEPRWIAYHLELAPKLRIPKAKAGKPPTIGFVLCDKLANILRALLASAASASRTTS